MAEPIVFINSDMASYISGERRIVDYGCTAEEVAGIKPVGTVIDLSAILGQLQQGSQQ